MGTYYSNAFTAGADNWIGIGPISFQASRLGYYFVAFAFGVIIGSYGLEQGLFKEDSKLAKNWWLWVIIGLGAFCLHLIPNIIINSLVRPLNLGIPTDLDKFIFYETIRYNLRVSLFPIISVSMMFMFIALFLRFFTRQNKVFDSLKNNAYGMYIFHYTIVSWLQYGFLFVPNMHGLLKILVIFPATVLLSWGFTVLVRLIPGVKQII
jgi:hypothetical protein